jgi:hypothetical protein
MCYYICRICDYLCAASVFPFLLSMCHWRRESRSPKPTSPCVSAWVRAVSDFWEAPSRRLSLASFTAVFADLHQRFVSSTFALPTTLLRMSLLSLLFLLVTSISEFELASDHGAKVFGLRSTRVCIRDRFDFIESQTHDT